MNYLQQFENLLNGMEDSESKTSLVTAFANVKTDFSESITSRDNAKSKLNESKEFIQNLGKTIGLSEGFGIDDVKGHIDSLSNSKKLDELKETLTQQHEAEATELRTLLETANKEKLDLTTKANDLLFGSAINKDGLLNGFVDNPKMRGLVENELKSKLLFEDGNIYVKDDNGNKAKDIKTNEYLTPKSIVESMQNSDEWKGFVSPQTAGKNGSGMPSNQVQNGNGGLKRSAMSHKEKGEYIKEHGQDAYLQLNN